MTGRIRTAVTDLVGPDLVARLGFDDLVAVLLSSMREVALPHTSDPRDHRPDANLVLWQRPAGAALG